MRNNPGGSKNCFATAMRTIPSPTNAVFQPVHTLFRGWLASPLNLFTSLPSCKTKKAKSSSGFWALQFTDAVRGAVRLARGVESSVSLIAIRAITHLGWDQMGLGPEGNLYRTNTVSAYQYPKLTHPRLDVACPRVSRPDTL